MKRLLAFCIAFIVLLTGCVPSRHLVNEASVIYRNGADFHDPRLDSNRVKSALVLVYAAYVQARNEKQLSIYLECDSMTPLDVVLKGGLLRTKERHRISASSFSLNCLEEEYGQSPKYHGKGYLHFFDDNLFKFMSASDLTLELSIEADGQILRLDLPLKSKVAWVWPT